MLSFLIVGVLTAIVVYPIMHEFGHIAMAILVNVDVVRICLFPFPCVVCEVNNNDIRQVFISLGGIFFPYLFSMLFRPQNFWLWYANLLVKGIGTNGFFFSAIAIIFYENGNYQYMDDAIQVLHFLPNGGSFFIVFLLVMGWYGVMRIIKEKPVSRCVSYLCFLPKKENCLLNY